MLFRSRTRCTYQQPLISKRFFLRRREPLSHTRKPQCCDIRNSLAVSFVCSAIVVVAPVRFYCCPIRFYCCPHPLSILSPHPLSILSFPLSSSCPYASRLCLHAPFLLGHSVARRLLVGFQWPPQSLLSAPPCA